MSVKVPTPDSTNVTPELLTSDVTLADTTMVVAVWIWVTLAGVDRATPVPTPTLPVTPRLLLLLQAFSARARVTGSNRALATTPRRHGDPGRITVNDFSSNPGIAARCGGTDAPSPPLCV